MKTLKITFVLIVLSVLFVTVSSQNANVPKAKTVETIKKSHTEYDLLAHARKRLTPPNQS